MGELWLPHVSVQPTSPEYIPPPHVMGLVGGGVRSMVMASVVPASEKETAVISRSISAMTVQPTVDRQQVKVDLTFVASYPKPAADKSKKGKK